MTPEQVRMFSEALMRAGWIGATDANDLELSMDVTPYGRKKMKELWELLREVNAATMADDDFTTFMEFLRNTARSIAETA